VVIDEAHGSIGRHGAARAVFDPTTKGQCLTLLAKSGVEGVGE